MTGLVLNPILQASPAGILIINKTTSTVSFNPSFAKMWGVQRTIAEDGNEAPILQHMLNQLADPLAFSDDLKCLRDRPTEASTEEMLLRDGRVYERHSAVISQPNGKHVDCVWYFHDITIRKQAVARRNRALEQTIQVIADIIDMRDHYTAGHGRQVAEIASEIANEMGLASDRIHGLNLAALIHDLGKVAVPAEIINKSAPLTHVEYRLIQEHPKIGHDALKSIDFPWPIADIILQHHERHDGSGYPNALIGDSILLESRIVGVADVVDSMMSHRPYRPALGLEAALAEIKNGSGRLYNPAVVVACEKVMRRRYPVSL